MKLYASCMTCLLAGQEKKLREYPDENIKAQYMKELMRLVADSSEDDSALWLAAQIGKISEKYFGKAQDYTEEKEEFLSLFDRTGDSIDREEYDIFCRELEKARRLVYLFDNCGEIVLDKLVIGIIKERYPQLKITGIVRGMQVINDATMEDAVLVGLTREIEVMGNGDDAAGTILGRISKEARKNIEEADMILAKGQGNFESLFGCGLNIYYLFLCKCDWFMRRFQVERYHGMFVNEKRIG